jgi:HD-like signal output (HDOD) protein
VQRVLDDEQADVDQVAAAVNLEPALAVLILRIANSAAYNRTARQVREMRLAVQRVGNRMVRAATVAQVVQQLRHADELRLVRERLQSLWRRGMAVGAVARVLVARVPAAAPDAALLAGLMHVVPRLFVLTRLVQWPQLLDQPGLPERLMEEWGRRVTPALLKSWEVPEDLRTALLRLGDAERTRAGTADLADVLEGAVVLADLLPPSKSDYLDLMQLSTVYLQTEALWRHLGLSREQCSDAVHTAVEDLQQLRTLFGS